MRLKTIVDEDFNNYKKPSMLLGFPQCTFKCENDCGKQVCQNSALATAPTVDVNIENIFNRYKANNLTSAVVLGGLEPMDSWNDLFRFIKYFREYCNDDIVIYTGYNKDELSTQIKLLQSFPNIIIKFGRFIPNEEKHLDEVLGVELASNNQYAEMLTNDN